MRQLVRAQFAAIPPRDVLRYNKSMGWSHQEFVEAWGLRQYVLGARAPMLHEFTQWLNDSSGNVEAAAEAASTDDAARLSCPAACAPMY